MRSLMRTLIVLFVSVLIAGRFAAAQQQSNNNKNKKKQQSSSALADAQKATSDARKNLDEAKKNVATANEAVRAAQKEIDEANKALRKIEDETIDGQTADSDFGKTRDAFRAAQKKYQDARNSVLNDETFKTRLAEAKESEDRGTALLALKKEFDEMPVIADSRAAMQSAKDVYEPMKAKLLEGTSDWTKANDDLKAKRKVLDEANHKFSEATAAAKRAKEALAKAEAAERAAQVAASQQQQPTKRGRRNYNNGY